MQNAAPALAALLPLATVTTYIASCLLGIFISSARFDSLGINYLHFATITDILTLPLIHFGWTILLFTTSIAASALLKSRFQSQLESTPEEGRADRSHSLYFERDTSSIVFTTLALCTLLWILARIGFSNDISRIKEGESERVNVELSDSRSLTCAAIIGSSSEFMFFWDNLRKQPLIVKRDDVRTISVVVPPKPTGEKPKKPGTTIPFFAFNQTEWEGYVKNECIKTE